MRVLLISANTEQVNIPPLPLGLDCVAQAARNAGHEVELLDLMSRGDIRSAVVHAHDALRPDVIGVSVRNIDDQSMQAPKFLLERVRDVVSLCRELTNAPIVLGGAGYSIFPESALDYLNADMGIQGEGELAFPVLLERIEKKLDLSDVPGLYMRGRGLQCERAFADDLDALPLPGPRISDRDVTGRGETWLPVQTRRGCPMDCSYCSTGLIEGRTIRTRSPELVVENIARHVEAGFRRFYFVDNTFNLPKAYAKEVCRLIIRRGLEISWRCILYPGGLDEELVHLLAQAGCIEVSLGFESGCDRILKSMNKKFRARDVRADSEMLKCAGIRRMGFLLLGGPGETRLTVLESLAFAESLGLEAMKISCGVRIYPGTKLGKAALEEGVVFADDDLLFPRFYMARGLGEWTAETVAEWKAGRPSWTI
jgi:radical SAM superfamily enzyme YgiQ (UPF0313 family)